MNLSHFQNIPHVNGEANLIVRNISRDKKNKKNIVYLENIISEILLHALVSVVKIVRLVNN